MTTPAELDMPTVTVFPGTEATTTLTVRNDSDIVEAYELDVVGECAAWSIVEPARVSLYPGTSQTVVVRLAPPRSPEVLAGEVPLGVRVQPVEHPESVTVAETTVHIGAFAALRTELAPRRRRGWRGASFRITTGNLGNTPTTVALAASQAGEDLRLRVPPQVPPLDPGGESGARLRVRSRRIIWFGKPVTWPFDVDVEAIAAEELAADEQLPRDRLAGEFVQLSVLPRWLLALLAALLALIAAWFALVRPVVQSTARQAAKTAGQQLPVTGTTQAPGGGGQAGAPPGTGQSTGTGTGGGNGTGNGQQAGTAPGQQSSTTIDIHTNRSTTRTGSYTVPQGSTFAITDIVIANFQGDEGTLTILFGGRTITTIALETFRNQDYHWVTPIEVPANAQVVMTVTCTQPGTPASGHQAANCHELLNVSGDVTSTAP